jgi:V/A-type H+-transporting ATPase subunit D
VAVKLTKNELKNQKDALRRFERYLPTLQLKKQQLQMVIRQVEAHERQKREAKQKVVEEIMSWVGVFAEEVELSNLLNVEELIVTTGNIAGIDIPVFEDIRFHELSYDLFRLPLWVDRALVRLKELVRLDAEVAILQKQQELLGEELRITTQRVNLFEKVKIPETRENIRRIRIYLGDEQTAAVVRGKIAKNNIMRAGSADSQGVAS